MRETEFEKTLKNANIDPKQIIDNNFKSNGIIYASRLSITLDGDYENLLQRIQFLHNKHIQKEDLLWYRDVFFE